jgi:hypothetical protein
MMMTSNRTEIGPFQLRRRAACRAPSSMRPNERDWFQHDED